MNNLTKSTTEHSLLCTQIHYYKHQDFVSIHSRTFVVVNAKFIRFEEGHSIKKCLYSDTLSFPILLPNIETIYMVTTNWMTMNMA